MTKYTYRMDRSNRKHVAHSICNFMHRKSDNSLIFGLADALALNDFPENEELILWQRMWDLLDDRRKSDKRDELLKKIVHACVSISQPALFPKSSRFERVTELYF